MWPDRVSNPGPFAHELDALPTALRGPASYLKTRKRVIGKQCRPRSDATSCGVRSGSTSFANRIFHQK